MAIVYNWLYVMYFKCVLDSKTPLSVNFSLLQGTEFMANLSICLRYYIADRLNNDPGWRNIKVSTLHLNVSFDSFVLFW